MLAGLRNFRISSLKKSFAPKVKSTESGKLDYLESVRGLAALSVVFAHIIATYFPGASVGPSAAPAGNDFVAQLFYGLPLGFMISGHFAVVVFFTLSGFVLTYKYFQSRDQKDIQKQAAKRFFRLAIPIFAIVMCSYFMLSNGAMANVDHAGALTQSPELARIFNFDPILAQAFYDATIGVIFGGSSSYNPVLWTMNIEFIGSFVVFGFALLVGGMKKRWILYLGAIIALSHTYFVCFILGMILADLVNSTKFVQWVRTNVSKVYVFILLGVILVIASFPDPFGRDIPTVFQSLLIPQYDSSYIYKLWQYAAAFALLVIVVTQSLAQKILNVRLFVFLGGVSFAVYLTHYLILHSIGDSLFVALFGSLGQTAAAIVAGFVTIVVTIGISILWKRYIDDMSVNVSRNFARFLLR